MKMIRNILIPLVLMVGLLPTAGAQSNINAIDTYFKQYVDDERFTVVYISSKLFQMIGSLDKESVAMDDDNDAKALMDIARDMQGLRILTSEEDVDELYAEAKAKINTTEYEALMTVRSRDGDNLEFLVRENEEKIEELLLLSGGDEFILMSFIGNLSMDKISRLAREIEH